MSSCADFTFLSSFKDRSVAPPLDTLGIWMDVKIFTEATATWRTLWLDGVGMVQEGAGPSGRYDMHFLAVASKLWVLWGLGMDAKGEGCAPDGCPVPGRNQ